MHCSRGCSSASGCRADSSAAARWRLPGVALLLVHEWRAAPLDGNVGLGIVLAIGGMLAASIANVVQANPTGRGVPMVSLLAWAMLYGTIFDLGFATASPQVRRRCRRNGSSGRGRPISPLIGSVVTFPLHYNLVREIGAGRTAYNGIVTVLRGDAAVDRVRRLSLDAADRERGGAGAAGDGAGTEGAACEGSAGPAGRFAHAIGFPRILRRASRTCGPDGA